MIQMNLPTEQKQSHRQRTHVWLPQGKGGERDELGVRD